VKDGFLIDIGYEVAADKSMTGNVVVNIVTNSSTPSLEIIDNAYGQKKRAVTLGKNSMLSTTLDLSKSGQWYDASVRVPASTFELRFAGRVETGKDGVTDPALDGVNA
jgi:phospholipase C